MRLYRKPLVRLWIDCAWEMRVNVPDGLLTYKVEGPSAPLMWRLRLSATAGVSLQSCSVAVKKRWYLLEVSEVNNKLSKVHAVYKEITK